MALGNELTLGGGIPRGFFPVILAGGAADPALNPWYTRTYDYDFSQVYPGQWTITMYNEDMRHDDDITIACDICGHLHLPWSLGTFEFGNSLVCGECADELRADANEILDICD